MNRSRFLTRLAAIGAIATALPACDSLLGTDQAAFANRARVIVEGTSAGPLQLLTSTNFVALRDLESGELVASEITGETLSLTAFPYDHEYTIAGADRFLVRLTNPDIDITATVHLRVFLDGREVYTQHATMRDASLQYIAHYRP
jgi:hypothetical protein